jgi:hypothetical protein
MFQELFKSNIVSQKLNYFLFALKPDSTFNNRKMKFKNPIKAYPRDQSNSKKLLKIFNTVPI